MCSRGPECLSAPHEGRPGPDGASLGTLPSEIVQHMAVSMSAREAMKLAAACRHTRQAIASLGPHAAARRKNLEPEMLLAPGEAAAAPPWLVHHPGVVVLRTICENRPYADAAFPSRAEAGEGLRQRSEAGDVVVAGYGSGAEAVAAHAQGVHALRLDNLKSLAVLPRLPELTHLSVLRCPSFSLDSLPRLPRLVALEHDFCETPRATGPASPHRETPRERHALPHAEDSIPRAGTERPCAMCLFHKRHHSKWSSKLESLKLSGFSGAALCGVRVSCARERAYRDALSSPLPRPMESSPLPCLTVLELARCKNLQALPNLPCLARLVLRECGELASLGGPEGLPEIRELRLHHCHSLLALPALPKATLVELKRCGNLSALSPPGGSGEARLRDKPCAGCIPQLVSLSIDASIVLGSLPLLPKVESLRVSACPMLDLASSVPENTPSLTEFKVVSCRLRGAGYGSGRPLGPERYALAPTSFAASRPRAAEEPEQFLAKQLAPKPLQSLEVFSCPGLTSLLPLFSAPLEYDDTDGPRRGEGSVQENTPLGERFYAPALAELRLLYCSELIEIPAFSNLAKLRLMFCTTLRALPFLPSLAELSVEACPSLEDLGGAPKLVRLRLAGCKALSGLPALPALSHLVVECCPILELPALPGVEVRVRSSPYFIVSSF